MTWRKGALRCFLALVVALAAVTVVAKGRRIEIEEQAPVGKFTGSQAIQKAEPWIWRLVRFRPGLLLTAESTSSAPGASKVCQQWTVICNDADGAYGGDRAVVVFDAQTSRLRSAARIVRSEDDVPRTKNANQAMRIAEDWLTDLGPSESASPWVAKSATPTGRIWAVRCMGGNRMAIVMVRRHSGQICSVYLSP